MGMDWLAQILSPRGTATGKRLSGGVGTGQVWCKRTKRTHPARRFRDAKIRGDQ